MEQLIAADFRWREDDATVQKTVDGCQQVLAVISLVRRLVEVLTEQNSLFSLNHFTQVQGTDL